MKRERVVIVDGLRTPFCRAGSDLATLSADDLGRTAVSALLTKTGIDPTLIDEVIFGCVAQPAEAANVARVVALRAGIPERVPAVTVHRNCASGCEAITRAADKISAGRGSMFLVGGTESMTHVPLLFNHRAALKFGRLARAKSWGQKLGGVLSFRPPDFQPRIGLMLGLTDPVCGLNMGETAELLAREFRISREEQDAFAVESHRKAMAAREKLAEEICPAYVGAKNPILRDNGIREDQSPEKLANLKPVFDRRNGTVTAANASQVTDGAVALLVMSESRAAELGLKPLGALIDYRYAGCDPSRMGLGPVFAIARAAVETKLRPADADVVEINEAFAAQVLAVQHCLKSEKFLREHALGDEALGPVPRERLNVNGGAIALGHPVGSSGARLVLTCLKELRRRKGKRGLISLCVGGGQGAALWLEAL